MEYFIDFSFWFLQSLNDGLIPQLFTSVPSLNEAASYLAQSTSLFTRCFSDYSGILIFNYNTCLF